jgi:hypothetical protein
MANEFVTVFRNMERAINTSKKQALNKAGVSTRARYAKEISADIGISSARAKSRVRIYKGSSEGTLSVTVSIGVRVPFAAQDFKPKAIAVMSALGKRFGATYTVKGRATELAPGGFLVTGSQSGKLVVIKRVGKDRYPTTTVLVPVFLEAVERLKPLLDQHMIDTFERTILSQIKFNLG